MAKRGGGFGFVMLLVVLAVVLLLVARAWDKTAPAAGPILSGTSGAETVAPHGQPEAADALRNLPGLKDVRTRTDSHAKDVADALAATE